MHRQLPRSPVSWPVGGTERGPVVAVGASAGAMGVIERAIVGAVRAPAGASARCNRA
jgi:hypothetical protein